MIEKESVEQKVDLLIKNLGELHSVEKTSDYTYDVRYNDQIMAFEFIKINNSFKFETPQVIWRICKGTLVKFLNEVRHEN